MSPELAAVLVAWRRTFGDRSMTVQGAVASASLFPNGQELLDVIDRLLDSRSHNPNWWPLVLGGLLSSARGQVFRGLRLVDNGRHRGARRWRVEPVVQVIE